MTEQAGQTDIAKQMCDCIVAIAERQDRAAFERLFLYFAPRVKGYLVRLGGDRATAEELMQETMTLVWRKAAQFDPSRSSASTWIFTIARNLRIDAFRREKHPEVDDSMLSEMPDGEPLADAAVAARQDAVIVGKALSRLSAAEQQVLRLAYFEDQPQSAIAGQLGIPLGTVKSRVRLAFAKLRDILVEQGAGR